MNLFSKIKNSFKKTVDKIESTVNKAKDKLHDIISPTERAKKEFGTEVKKQYTEVEQKFGKRTAKILQSRGLDQNTKVDNLAPDKVKDITKTVKAKPLTDVARIQTKAYIKGYFDTYFMELKGSKKYDEKINSLIDKFDGNLSKAYQMVDKMEKGDISNIGTDPLLYDDPEAFREEMINRLSQIETWVERNVK